MVDIASGSPPPGTSLSFSGNSILISGTPSGAGSYPITLSIAYAAGTDGSGKPYPAGTTATVAATITVAGVAPPPTPGIPPVASSVNLTLSNSVPLTGGGAMIATLNYGSIQGASVSTGSLPPGLSLVWAGNLLAVDGTPTQSNTFPVSLSLAYPAGTDPSGNSYPAGSATATATITVLGCPGQAVSWTDSGAVCFGNVGISASAGANQTINSTSASLAGYSGTGTFACAAASGAWNGASGTCSLPGSCPAQNVQYIGPGDSTCPPGVPFQAWVAPASPNGTLRSFFEGTGVNGFGQTATQSTEATCVNGTWSVSFSCS